MSVLLPFGVFPLDEIPGGTQEKEKGGQNY